MISSNAFSIPRTSGRRLTPQTLAELTLPTEFSQLAPVWVSPGQTITDFRDEDPYTGILTNVTEIDEAISDQKGITAAKRSARCFHTRFDAVYGIPKRVESPRQPHKGGLGRIFATIEVQKEEGFGCGTFEEPDGHVELLFDAGIPVASDEDLAFRGGFAPSTAFARIDLSRASEECLALSPTHELFDDSELKVQLTLAVDDTRDGISTMLDHYALPAADQSEGIPLPYLSRREGRPLIRTTVPAKATASNVGEDDEKALTQKDYEQALRRITGPSFLPGINQIQNVNVRSVFMHYDDDIENLCQATRSFLEDHHDGECACLDGKPDVFPVPGEDFLLTENEGDVGLSIQRPNAQSIFDAMDEVVRADMLDDAVSTEASSDLSDLDVDGFVEIDFFGDGIPGPDDTANSWQAWDHGMYFDTASQMIVDFSELQQKLYAPSSSTVSSLFEDCSNSGVSDMCAIDADSSCAAQSSELSCVDTDTQQLISYTAYNQLLHMNEVDDPSRIRQDFHGTYASEVAPTVISEKCLGGGLKVRPSDSPNSSRSNSSVSYVRLGLLQPPPPTPEQESRVRRRCPPHDLYSSNRSGHISKPRLTIKTQLVPKPQLLATVEEEEGLVALISPSSDVSPEFADQRGFVVPLQTRCENFLDDYDDDDDDDDVDDEDEDDKLESMFTDVIWHVSPDLSLSHLDEIPCVIPTPPPASQRYLMSCTTFERFETEINSILTHMFDCINRGQMHELAALNNHLYQTLDAILPEYPAMTVVRILGVSVGILFERMVISTLAF